MDESPTILMPDGAHVKVVRQWFSQPEDPINPDIESSPFRAHIGTNYAPTTDELTHIHALISDMASREKDLAVEIDTLFGEINRLSRLRQPILTAIAEHKALTSPIRRLPVEILQQIFIECVPHHIPAYMHIDEMPMVLTLVCKPWREIAYSTPRLWASMHIPIPPDTAVALNTTLQRAKAVSEWLQRSGSVPLQLSIAQWAGPTTSQLNGTNTDLAKLIFDVIRPHSARWLEIILALPTDSLALFKDIEEYDIPLLRNVQTETFGDSTRVGAEGSAMALRRLLSAPLEKISVIFPHNLSLSDINVSRLTHLLIESRRNVSDMTSYDYLSCLNAAQNLEYLRIHIAHPPFDYNPKRWESTFTLPRLKQLAVREATNFPDFGKYVRLPQLERLEYIESIIPDPGNITPNHQGNTPPAWERIALSTLLSYSGTFVKELTFRPRIYRTKDIISFLRNCPAIEVLLLVEVSNGPLRNSRDVVNNDLLQAFVTEDPDLGGGVCCPRLKTLICERAPGFTAQQFLDFLQVKQTKSTDGIAMLERVAIQFGSPDIPGLSDKVDALLPQPGRGRTFINYQDGPCQVSLKDGPFSIAPSWTSLNLGQFMSG